MSVHGMARASSGTAAISGVHPTSSIVPAGNNSVRLEIHRPNCTIHPTTIQQGLVLRQAPGPARQVARKLQHIYSFVMPLL
jgi:hypothetical protein